MNSTETRKQYIISFEDRDSYLYVHVKGTKEDLASARAMWSEIAEKTISSAKNRLLVVEDIEESISIAEVHHLVSEFCEQPLIDIKIAFCDIHPEHKSLNEFGSLVGSNRGMTVQVFDTEKEAEVWLLAD